MTGLTDKAPARAKTLPPAPPSPHMVWIPGGTFRMGSNDFYPEERPAHRVTVDGFWMDEHPVTNAEFARFVRATGYVTVAERVPDPTDYPGIDPALLLPGSLVFRRPAGPADLRDPRFWQTVVRKPSARPPHGVRADPGRSSVRWRRRVPPGSPRWWRPTDRSRRGAPGGLSRPVWRADRS